MKFNALRGQAPERAFWPPQIGRGFGLARYFFNISTASRMGDEAGMEFHDLTQVRHEALSRAAEFASDVRNLEEPGAIVVTARDEAGDIVVNVRLVCVVEDPDRTE